MGLWVAGQVSGHRAFAIIPFVGFLVAGLAYAFAQITGESTNLVLFSGQDALNPLIANAGTFTVGTLLLLIVGKGVAWGLSLGAFRGGPTFPAMFIGAAGGLAASHLPGLPMSAARARGDRGDARVLPAAARCRPSSSPRCCAPAPAAASPRW